MKNQALKSACYRLDQLVYKHGAVNFPSAEETSHQAEVIRQLYQRCLWALDRGRFKLLGRALGTKESFDNYEDLRSVLESTISDYVPQRDAIRMLDICEEVLNLLKDTD